MSQEGVWERIISWSSQSIKEENLIEAEPVSGLWRPFLFGVAQGE
ncbi:MAG: hypothetical protein V3W43_06575 [Desulfatiglandaceae bacterium]